MNSEFCLQLDIAATTGALTEVLRPHLNRETNIQILDHRTTMLASAMRQASSRGINVFSLLIQSGLNMTPTSTLLFAHQIINQGDNCPRGHSKWQYLMWFLTREFGDVEKQIRLADIFKHLRGDTEKDFSDDSKVEISALARSILNAQHHSRLPEGIVILCFDWLLKVSSITTVLSIRYTQRDHEDIPAMPFLIKIAKNPERLKEFNGFLDESSGKDTMYLTVALCKALKEEKVPPEHKEDIAELMLDQMLVANESTFLSRWTAYAEALIGFYHDHCVTSHRDKVISVCKKSEEMVDQSCLPMSPKHRAWELLACLSSNEVIFHSLWSEINDSTISMEERIADYNERQNQCHAPRQEPVYAWKEIVKRLIRACYRDNLSFGRLVDALRNSPLGPVSLIMEELGNATILSLFDRGSYAVVFPPALKVKNDDPKSVRFLLSIIPRHHMKIPPEVLPESKSDQTVQPSDEELLKVFGGGTVELGAAARLKSKFDTLSPELQWKVALLNLWHAPELSGPQLIQEMGGAKHCYDLLKMANTENSKGMALNVALRLGHLFRPLCDS